MNGIPTHNAREAQQALSTMLPRRMARPRRI